MFKYTSHYEKKRKENELVQDIYYLLVNSSRYLLFFGE